MKKLLLVCLLGMSFTACKKDDTTSNNTNNNNNNTSTIPTDGWTLNGTKYKQLYCLRQSGQFVLNCVDATTKPINSFAAFFHDFPTANGTYKIVTFTPDPNMKYPGEKIGANDVIIMGSVPNTATSDKSYWSTGLEGKSATVTVTNGKIKVEVPEVAVTDTKDTLKITGTMVEN